jgi:phosphohistidine phosphatase
MQTVELVARAADAKTVPTFEDRIYGASSAELLALVRAIPDISNCALLVGHNPAFEELLSRLSNAAANHMATCSLARLEFPIDQWKDVEDGQGKLVWLLTPKDLK